jgi:hypothetical protein
MLMIRTASERHTWRCPTSTAPANSWPRSPRPRSPASTARTQSAMPVTRQRRDSFNRLVLGQISDDKHASDCTLRGVTAQKRTILSGGLAGFAVGCCLAWIMNIAQTALGPFAVGPAGPNGNTYYYPPIALTIFVIIATCTGAGLAVGMMIWAILGKATPDRSQHGQSGAGASPAVGTRHDEGR